MAISTDALQDIVNANIYENTTGDISAEKMKEVFEVLIDSLNEAYDIIGTNVLINNATSAPSKNTLNSLYGTRAIGFIVLYPAITSGPKQYLKLTDTDSGNWAEYTPVYVV